VVAQCGSLGADLERGIASQAEQLATFLGADLALTLRR